MPWNLGPSVNVHGCCDYWRTWFFDECEEAQRFGLTERHLPLITKYGDGVTPYAQGTTLFLEDAPYFKASCTHHRVAGPYEVFAPMDLDDSAVRIYPKEGPMLVWQEPTPQAGPWLDKSYVSKTIDGLRVKFSQQASRFGFFPYRFAIRRAKKWRIEHIAHASRDCWLCR